MHAETQETGQWWARSRGATTANWIANYQRSLGARHRTAIAGIVRDLQAETLLEVGCHCGPNLVRLAAECPDLRMLGIDINTEAIAAGKLWVTSQGLASRIQLTVGPIPGALAALPSGCCDVVLSCYALAYIAPADLDAVLYEMGRLAAKAVVIAEPMVTETTPAGPPMRALSGYTEWRHDYQQASRWLGSWRGMRIGIGAISPPVDKLTAILVGQRLDAESMRSSAPMPWPPTSDAAAAANRE